MKLVAEGLKIDSLASADEVFAEGDRGEARIYLGRKLSDIELAHIKTGLLDSKITLEAIGQEAHIAFLRFRKLASPFDAIIEEFRKIGAEIRGWQVFKDFAEMPWWVWVVLGSGVIALLIASRK